MFRIRLTGFQDESYLNISDAGVVSLVEGENRIFVITKSGLLREAFTPNFALKTTDGDGLTFLSGSEDLGGAVLRCSLVSGTLSCSQGAKSVFYVCPTQADGTNLAIGDPDLVASGAVGADCQAISFYAENPCQK